MNIKDDVKYKRSISEGPQQHTKPNTEFGDLKRQSATTVTLKDAVVDSTKDYEDDDEPKTTTNAGVVPGPSTKSPTNLVVEKSTALSVNINRRYDACLPYPCVCHLL